MLIEYEGQAEYWYCLKEILECHNMFDIVSSTVEYFKLNAIKGLLPQITGPFI